MTNATPQTELQLEHLLDFIDKEYEAEAAFTAEECTTAYQAYLTESELPEEEHIAADLIPTLLEELVLRNALNKDAEQYVRQAAEIDELLDPNHLDNEEHQAAN